MWRQSRYNQPIVLAFVLLAVIASVGDGKRNRNRNRPGKRMPAAGVYEPPRPQGEIAFYEPFKGPFMSDRWTVPDSSRTIYKGVWQVREPYFDDTAAFLGDRGIVTTTAGARHAISAACPLSIPHNTPTVLQFEFRMQLGLSCGEAMIHLLPMLQPKGYTLNDMLSRDADYVLAFGLSFCQGKRNEVRFSFSHRDSKTDEMVRHHLIRPPMIATDTFTHLYTLTVYPNDTFVISADMIELRVGTLYDDFSPPLQQPILIDDPTDQRPDNWETDKTIPDPASVRPVNWDEEGQGPFVQARIPNPRYNGEWRARRVPNPDFVEIRDAYRFESIRSIALFAHAPETHLMFDNIILANDLLSPKRMAMRVWQRKAHEERRKAVLLNQEGNWMTRRIEKFREYHEDFPILFLVFWTFVALFVLLIAAGVFLGDKPIHRIKDLPPGARIPLPPPSSSDESDFDLRADDDDSSSSDSPLEDLTPAHRIAERAARRAGRGGHAGSHRNERGDIAIPNALRGDRSGPRRRHRRNR